jgi:heat shock protein HslJ
LPAELPAGERMLWQGTPSWRALARRSLHVRKVGAYFVLLSAWHVIEVTNGGAGVAEAVRGAAWLVLLGAAAVGVLSLLAWALARSTMYTITTARLVLRFGVALPMSVNLPLKLVAAADLRRHADGTADLPLTLAPGQRAPQFTIASDGTQVSGHGGCNRMSGPVEIRSDRIGFSRLASTRMACATGQQLESAFFDALERSARWKISGSQLELRDSRGRVLARLEAAPVR